uniref:Molybdate-anion transporter n=1 Tax=Phaeomonas parva TaxID=124430 RepID=A0A7S1U518_9STRA|mmetsp:Transcript_29453/g.94579  ORF Transcript_29453/g.94579 Transcript_29453/m.94579 type:complete len:502 (+) Transcript_29453:118-1623(+)
MAAAAEDNGEFFWNVFYLISIVCAGVQVYTRRTQGEERNVAEVQAPPGFGPFQRSFLTVTLLAMLADWLQGPYVYALYKEYGYDQGTIGLLFVAGFLSSAVFGTVAGGAADFLGRKKACQAYAIIYIISALTKLSPNFMVLLCGRITGGLATSLLFTSFEAWMVSEHFKRGFPENLLPQTFSYLTLGNGIMAVSAGIIAQGAASMYGPVAPFMVCIAPLAANLAIVTLTWTENYGAESDAASAGMGAVLAQVAKGVKEGVATVRTDKKLMYLGLGQTCFEAGMYTFVFMWTPALQANAAYHDAVRGSLGLIFAIFMVCTMTGSGVYGRLSSEDALGVRKLQPIVHAVAAMSCVAPALLPFHTPLMMLSFMALETMVGMFYPMYGTLRGAHVPEDKRAAIMSLFRVPLNLFVVVVLGNVQSLSTSVVFVLCLAVHVAGFEAQLRFRRAADAKTTTPPSGSGGFDFGGGGDDDGTSSGDGDGDGNGGAATADVDNDDASSDER